MKVIHRKYGWVALAVLIVLALTRFVMVSVFQNASEEDSGGAAQDVPSGFLLERALPESADPRATAPISGREATQPVFEMMTSSDPLPAPQSMSDEELALLDESLIVTRNMRLLLDDGDEVRALEAARLLPFHSNREVRLEVFRTLDWIGLPAAMDMASMMDDEDEEIREAARDSFWNMMEDIEDESLHRDLLGTALKSSDPELRKTVLDEALHLPDILSFELIASAVNDADEFVTETAWENIGFISGEEFESRKDALIWFEKNKEDLSP